MVTFKGFTASIVLNL